MTWELPSLAGVVGRLCEGQWWDAMSHVIASPLTGLPVETDGRALRIKADVDNTRHCTSHKGGRGAEMRGIYKHSDGDHWVFALALAFCVHWLRPRPVRHDADLGRK